MKRVLVLSVVLAVALVVASCAPAAPTPAPTAVTAVPTAGARTFRLGMVNLSLCCPYFIGMDAAVKAEAAMYSNIELISTDAGGDIEKLTSDVEDVLARDPDGIIVSAAWIEAAPEAMDAINAAGVPVVLVDRMLKGSEYTSWVGPDNYIIGVQDGQYIVDRLEGKGVLLDIRGGPADNSIGLDRTNGMLSEVQKTDIQVITAPDFGGWSSDGGYTIMTDMLAKYDKIDVVFCENDSMCLGAQKAITDAGRSDEMFLCGVDGEKEALVNISEGTNYACTGLNSSDQIGRASFHRLMEILAGGQLVDKNTILPSPLITINNVCQYYNPKSVF